MVVLAKGADLQGAAGQRVVLAPAGLPYLGQGAGGARQKEKKKKNTTQQHAKQGEEATWLSQLFALGSPLPMRSPQFWERTRHGNARDMRTGAGDHNPDMSGKTPRHSDGHRDLRKNSSLQHPKLKLPPLLGDGTPAVPREHPPRWVPAPRRCPNVPSRPQPAEERQNRSWQRFRQEGPQGRGKLTCTKVPGSSQAERKGWIL